jgi:hypothetical protein
MINFIITHAKCPDGWCAAFIAKKRYPDAEIMPLDHGSPVPFDVVKGRDVLVLDFSWPVREDNIKLHDLAKSFHIYDHHRTAQERLEGLPFVTFDMKRSGAGLAWDYLFGKDRPIIWEGEKIGKPFVYQTRPWYVSYVEDRDLWNWALPNSKAVNAYISTLKFTIEEWDYLDKIKVEQAEQFGIPVLRYIDIYVREVAAEAQKGVWWVNNRPYTTLVVGCPYVNCSEVGNTLAQNADVSLTYFERHDGQVQFSLRSIGDIDVSEIAKKFLGGGHQHAAGLRLPLDEARKMIDTILGRRDYAKEQTEINAKLDAIVSQIWK